MKTTEAATGAEMTVAMTEAIAPATKAGMVVAKREGGGDGGRGDDVDDEPRRVWW